MPPLSREEIESGIASRRWFHRIKLPFDLVTPGTREPEAWEMYKLPESLDGKRVLDVGAWDGGFSFESEARGAASVIAMDLWNTQTDPGSVGAGWDNFRFAHDALQSKVQPWNASVYDLLPWDGAAFRSFDLILFLEVLYHLHNPMLALRRIHDVLSPDGLCCLETWIDAEWISEPAAIFYPGSELNGDPSNWWGPNVACVQGMAKASGFASCELVWWRQDVHFVGRGKRAAFHLRRQ